MPKRGTILRNPPSVTGRSQMSLNSYGPLGAVRNKQLLGMDRDSQEYLYGELVGIRNSHLNMFPQIWEKLQRAKNLDWDKKIVGPNESADASGYEVVNHGTFEAMYAAIVEPWLGKYDTLREIVERYQRGEISEEEGAEELRQHGGRGEGFQVGIANSKAPSAGGMTATYIKARLRRDLPSLYEAVQRGDLSVNAAAIEAGFRRPPKPFDQIRRLLSKLTDEERQKLRAML